jgi:glycosyltransferase involved in cell wall biosynthesis
MIVVTFKGAPSPFAPLVGRVKGVTVGSYVRGPSVCAAMVDALQRFTLERDCFLFVAPGGRIHSARLWPVLEGTDWDVAAYVDHIGSAPKCPGVFSGIGRVSLETLLIRPTEAGKRVLARWAERCAVRPGNEAIEIAIALVETRVAFLQLGRAWIWRESEHRAHEPMAEPVVEFGFPIHFTAQAAPRPSTMTQINKAVDAVSEFKKKSFVHEVSKPPPKVREKRLPPYKQKSPEVLWNGHLYSYASYGKINREVLLRVANSVSVQLDSTTTESILVDEYTRTRIDPYKTTLIGPRAPFLRFFGPDFQPQTGRHRINWTLMETHGRVHRDMVDKVNENYDELWVCTRWNAETFRVGGVKVPISVVPLGVDRAIYRPQRRRKLPPCRLLSTSKRGTISVPSGFVFLSVGLPSARKGFEVAADALALAFNPRTDVDLVIATTHGPTSWTSKLAAHVAGSRMRVWVLEGRFNEHEMAGIYAASDAYVSASIAEGWNLTAHEAATCFRPVIVPRNSVHPEVFGENAFLFETDGVGRVPEVESVSPWYVGMEFSLLRAKARKSLAEAMQTVFGGGSRVRQKVQALDNWLSKFTWDATAACVVRRLIEVQP